MAACHSKRGLYLNSTLTACLLLSSLQAEATIIDQQYLDETSFLTIPGQSEGAQTFTPEVSGQLVAVDLKLGRSPSTPSTDLVNFFIWDLQGRDLASVPLTPVGLASATILNTEIPVEFQAGATGHVSDEFIRVEFNSPATVSAGIEYALIIDGSCCGSNAVHVAMGDGQVDSGYEFGQAYLGEPWSVVADVRDKWDLVFRTHVVPEPSTWTILVVGFFGFIAARTVSS